MSKNKRKSGQYQSESEGLKNQVEKPEAAADVSYGTFQAPQAEAESGRGNEKRNDERKTTRRLAKFRK
jgi:hypothetical protein